jgi:thioredoxin reductase (NADPH)
MSHPRLLEGEVRIVGARWSPRVHALKAFLARSRVPYRWSEPEHDHDAPVVLFPDGSSLQDPDIRQLAERLGLDTQPDARYYDLVVIGGGPAGLTGSIYAASEGLRTMVVEQEVPGGQATYSAIIENYPGFPQGLSGAGLARRMAEQAERFGVEILVTRPATRLRPDGPHRWVTLDDGTELAAHSILLAMGVGFRWLEAPGCPPLAGAGVYYGAAVAEATACRGQDIYVLGGGNSAGQAALLLAQHARQVVILTLESSLEETMSRYLVERIRHTPNIVVKTNHTVVGAHGAGRLESIAVQDLASGRTEQVPAEGLFIFIGASPRTEWLAEVVMRDPDGFVLSGEDLTCDGSLPRGWPLKRKPYRLESSLPGVFVAGDVRKRSVKRLACAVGEGAMAVEDIHQYMRGKQRGVGSVDAS